MPIEHHPIDREFTVLPNRLIRDESLKLKDVGLLCYMLSLPGDWDFSVNGLAAILKQDGKGSIQASIMRLEQQGYLTRNIIRDERGCYLGQRWDVSDLAGSVPLAENRSPDNRLPENRLPDIPSQTKKLLKKETNNKETIFMDNKSSFISSDLFTAPTAEQVRAICEAEGLLVDPENFVNYYTARGWELSSGRTMRDWKSCLRVWDHNRRQKEQAEQPAAVTYYTGEDPWENY